MTLRISSMEYEHTTTSLHRQGEDYQSSMSSISSYSSSFPISMLVPVVGTTMSKHDFNQYMTQWLRDNFIYPYPDNDMVDDLAARTGRTKSTINNWLSNNRSRKWYHVMETVLQLRRPSDFFYEDCVNLFDGKPLRVIPVDYLKTAAAAAATTKIATHSNIATYMGSCTDDRISISQYQKPNESLNANYKSVSYQSERESDDEWIDVVDVDDSLLVDIDIDDDDMFLSLIEKELEANDSIDSPLHQLDGSTTIESDQLLLSVSPLSQEKEDLPPLNVTIEWDTFYNASNSNASIDDETSSLLLPSLDVENDSHVSFMELTDDMHTDIAIQ